MRVLVFRAFVSLVADNSRMRRFRRAGSLGVTYIDAAILQGRGYWTRLTENRRGYSYKRSKDGE